MKILQTVYVEGYSEPTSHPICNVCGDGNRVTNGATTISIPNQPELTCYELDIIGRRGELTEVRCTSVKEFTSGLCGCEIDPNPPTTSNLAPTMVPSTAAPKNAITAGYFLAVLALFFFA
jgi:hypothetical protein